MSYVTEFNEGRIISDVVTKIDREITSKDLYHRIIPFLNALELSKLYDYKRFCEGDIDIEAVYKKADAIDRKKYVFEGNKPSYHRDPKCQLLHSSFKNIELPNEVRDWSDDDIEEYRRWFKKEIDDYENDEIIILKTKEEWGIECQVVRAKFRNSGSIYKENLELKNIEKRIDSLLLAQQNFFRQNSFYLARFSKATFLAFKAQPIPNNKTGLSDKELKEKLINYHNLFKEPIIYYLKEYYKVKFSKDIQFEETLLDSLGFKKCRSCYGEDYLFVLNLNDQEGSKTKLDEFLENRYAKRLCRKPSELKANASELNEGYLEFYYFCKLMAINGYVQINSKDFRELIIEYIFDDRIFYEKAYFDEEANGIKADALEIFNGYLLHTIFKNNDHKDFWRELFYFDYEEPTNLF